MKCLSFVFIKACKKGKLDEFKLYVKAMFWVGTLTLNTGTQKELEERCLSSRATQTEASVLLNERDKQQF